MFWIKTIKEIKEAFDNVGIDVTNLIEMHKENFKNIKKLKEELEIVKTKAIKAIQKNNI